MNPTPRDNSQEFVLVDAELASLARLCLPETRVLKRKAGTFPLWGWFLVAALGVFVNSRSRQGSDAGPLPDPDVSPLPPSGTPDLSSFEARPSGRTTRDGTNAATDDIRAALDLQCALLSTLLESERDIARLVSAQIGAQAQSSSSTGTRSIATPRSTPATVRPPERSSVPIVAPAQAPEAVEAPKTQPAPERRKRRRAPLLLLGGASLALNGVFIWHARSHVPRPSLVAGSPATGSPASPAKLGASASQAKLGAGAGQKSPGAVVRSGAGDVVSAPSGQTVRQQNPKHQSHAGRPSGRRASQPAQSAERASERPVPPAHAVAGRAGQHLRWNAVAGTTYYNLVLWRKGKRVLDLWPTSAQAVLPSTWSYHGTQDRLVPGRYLWFVYPGLGPKAARRYGALAGSGILVVQPKGGK
jgi:hypothetical protein